MGKIQIKHANKCGDLEYGIVMDMRRLPWPQIVDAWPALPNLYFTSWVFTGSSSCRCSGGATIRSCSKLGSSPLVRAGQTHVSETIFSFRPHALTLARDPPVLINIPRPAGALPPKCYSSAVSDGCQGYRGCTRSIRSQLAASAPKRPPTSQDLAHASLE